MTLFPDQQLLTQNIALALRDHRKVVTQLATGGGKTFIFSNIAHRWTQKQGTEVLIFVHRDELQTQTRRTLYNEFDIEAVAIVAGMKYIPPAPVYVGMIESTFKRLHKLSKIGLVIVDEAHIAVFNKIHEEFPDVKILAFTATPVSSSKKTPLNTWYEHIVCGPQISELIRLGRLAQNITYAPKTVITRSELSIKGGEFDEEKMSKELRKPKFINSTIKAYEERGVGLKTMIFNANIQHSLDVTAAFNAAGYECRHLGSDISKEERKDVLLWFKTCKKAIVSNVAIATTGFDEPTVEHIIVNKATMSLTLWLQMCGRGGRYIHMLKETFFITDMGGNALSHGDWNQDRDWKDMFCFPDKYKKPGVAPVKSCPSCDAIVKASTQVCEYCDYAFPKREIGIEEEMKEFVLVTKNIDIKKIMEEHKDKREYFTLFEIGNRIVRSFAEKEMVISETSFNFALGIYHTIAKQWTKERGKKFNQFHQDLVKKELLNKFKTTYPEWQVPQVLVSTIK